MHSGLSAFECPICAPKRFFVTELGLRTHVADRHPWRSLPQPGRLPASHVTPEPGWLRQRQLEGAGAANWDTQSQLSDDVFIEPSPHPASSRQARRDSLGQYPPADYDLSPIEFGRALDSLDSGQRKKRELATSRRPWYDEADYDGPRSLMDRSGYFNDDEDDLEQKRPTWDRLGDDEESERRRRHRLEERDSRIERLRQEIDQLWDERMRLLKRQADKKGADSLGGGRGERRVIGLESPRKETQRLNSPQLQYSRSLQYDQPFSQRYRQQYRQEYGQQYRQEYGQQYRQDYGSDIDY